jgi:hypothetical protein
LLSRLDTFARAASRYEKQVEEFYIDAVRDRYDPGFIKGWETSQRQFGTAISGQIDDLTRELEAVKSALEPAQGGKVSDAIRRARAIGSNLNTVQNSLGRGLRPPPPPPEPTISGRGSKPPPVSNEEFMATHNAAIAKNQGATDLPTATARYKGEPPKQLPPGGGGGRGSKAGPIKRWAGRDAALAEEGAVAESRLLRYGGKAMRGLRIAGTVALVVSAGIAIGSAAFHLTQGEYGSAAVDVADFFTLGGTSYVMGKTVEGVKALDDGMQAARAMRDWNEGGSVPPPQPSEETQQQRMERHFKQQESHINHPFGF